MIVHQIPCLNDNYVYLLTHEKTNQCIAIDPPEAQIVLDFTQKYSFQLEALWITHHHWDHIGANSDLKKLIPELKIFGYEEDAHRIPEITHLLKDKDSVFAFEFTNEFTVMHVPGHTSGHIAFYCEHLKTLFCGDTLFAGGCGRLFEGTAEQMYHSLIKKIALLPPDTLIYCAHEYTEKNLEFALTIDPQNRFLIERIRKVKELRNKNKPTVPSLLKEELLTNPFLRVHTDELLNSLKVKTQINTADPIEVFKNIRLLKDAF